MPTKDKVMKRRGRECRFFFGFFFAFLFGKEEGTPSGETFHVLTF